LTRLALGYAQAIGGDTAGARRTLTQALAALHSIGDAGGEAAAFATLGDVANREGLPFAAESLFRRGLARLRGAPAPNISWQ
ncbi:hypothetical protein ACSTLM_00680, partial [Vibrio parahaemolyticus]